MRSPGCAASGERRIRPVIGVNIGKSRVVEVADATADYLTSTRLLAPEADYLVVNVSVAEHPRAARAAGARQARAAADRRAGRRRRTPRCS